MQLSPPPTKIPPGPPMFPTQTAAYISQFQFSSWYPDFRLQSFRSKIIKPLTKEFQDYLHADGVFVPEGSENTPAISSLSDDEGDVNDDAVEESRQKYAFPELDKQIRDFIAENTAVFPKLNFSSPRDASWLLPSSSPLKCTSPADVYLLLKSSNFINHDLDPKIAYEGCVDPPPADYELELVLRKWYSVDPAREVRCFVRDNKLLAICQRDMNYYEFWNDTETQEKIRKSLHHFWDMQVEQSWMGQTDYIFDFLLVRDLSSGHLVDFNPYSPKTDPLLYTYEELEAFRQERIDEDIPLPTHTPLPYLRVIDSPGHPATQTNTPAHQHNRMPVEAIQMSSGKDIGEFAKAWQESVKEASAPEK